MGGKSRKSGGVSRRLIAQLKAGTYGKKMDCGKPKPKNDVADFFSTDVPDEGRRSGA